MIPNSKTHLFGIIGNPLGHTFSPAMHNSAYQAVGINAVYLPFPIKNLIGLKKTIKLLEIRGLSVTIPYKERVYKIVDKIDPLALQVGSINTLVQTRGGLIEGINTDGSGAVRAIMDVGLDLFEKKVTIIGSGGSARSIAFSLLNTGVKLITIVARNTYKTHSLAASLKLNKKAPQIMSFNLKNPLAKDKIIESDLLIQTTPIGMKGFNDSELMPIPSNFLQPNQWVFDIVYNPKKTVFLTEAEKIGCNIIYGYKMLLFQGVDQFNKFTGIDPPIDVMEAALKTELSYE